jgi:starch phosphorylase
MEIMLHTHIPTYAGSLDILAGDILRSCADMKIPAVGVSLVYKGTSFVQKFSPDGKQSYNELEWRKSDQFTKMPERIELTIDGKVVSVGCWRFDIVGFSDFVVPVFLLDTDYYTNDPWMRSITENLYEGSAQVRFCQEVLLGVGGVQMLKALGYDKVDCYHLNEGHAALAPLALLPENNWKDEEVKKKMVFTTHTPIPEGHDIFDYDLAYKYADKYLPWHIRTLAGQDKLHMSNLALNMSKYTCGVSKKHAEVSHELFPGYKIDSITNGVHHRTWTASTMQDLYNEYLPGWIEDPTQLKYAVEKIPNDKLWTAHQETKKVLIDFVNHHLTSTTSETSDPETRSRAIFGE